MEPKEMKLSNKSVCIECSAAPLLPTLRHDPVFVHHQASLAMNNPDDGSRFSKKLLCLSMVLQSGILRASLEKIVKRIG